MAILAATRTKSQQTEPHWTKSQPLVPKVDKIPVSKIKINKFNIENSRNF